MPQCIGRCFFTRLDIGELAAKDFLFGPTEQVCRGLIPAGHARVSIEADERECRFFDEGMEQSCGFVELVFRPLALRDIFTDYQDEDLAGLVMDRPGSFSDPQPGSVLPDFLDFPLKQCVGTGGTILQLCQHGFPVTWIKQFHDGLADEIFFQVTKLICSKPVYRQYGAVGREREIHEGVLFIKRLVALFTRLERRFSQLSPFDFLLEVGDGLFELRCAFTDLCFECVSKVLLDQFQLFVCRDVCWGTAMSCIGQCLLQFKNLAA